MREKTGANKQWGRERDFDYSMRFRLTRRSQRLESGSIIAQSGKAMLGQVKKIFYSAPTY